MAAPTLETNAAATILRITGGTSGDPVTFDDVWDWDDGGGSSGGDGDVPIDGGGTAKVSTFITEVVADAIYTVQTNLYFGNGSDSSYFLSKDEHVYFEDNVTFDIRSAATLQFGTLTAGYGEDGGSWSVGGHQALMISQTNVAFKAYDTRFQNRSANRSFRFYGGDVTLNKTAWSMFRGSMEFFSTVNSLNITDMYVSHASSGTDFRLAPTTLTGLHSHTCNYGIAGYEAEPTATGVRLTDSQVVDATLFGAGNTLSLVDLVNPASAPSISSATGTVVEQYTVNIHVNDKDGADVESATVAATSFGNIVSNDAGSTFYRCIEDHTSGTFATDVAAGKWELTTGANATLAGVTGAAGAGAWVTGVDYVKAAEEFSVATDADGDITEQTVDRKQWYGTSEAMLSFAPYTITLSKSGKKTLTLENIVLDAPIVWVQELQLGSILGGGNLSGGFL